MMNYLISRNMYKFNELSQDQWSGFATNIDSFNNWAKVNTKARLEVGAASKLTDEDKVNEYSRAKGILENRQKTFVKRDYDQVYNDGLGRMTKAILKEEDAALDTKLKAEKERLKQIEIANRPKPDPYDPKKDPHIKRIKEIMKAQASHKQQVMEENAVLEICNRFVNNYFYTKIGLSFAKEHQSYNITKTKSMEDEKILADLMEKSKEIHAEKTQTMNGQNISNHDGYDQSKYDGKVTSGYGMQNPSIKESNYVSHNFQKNNLSEYNENRDGMGPPKSSYRIKQGNAKSIVRMVEEEMAKLLEVEEDKNREYHFRKNKVFDVYGKNRGSFPMVKSIYQTNPTTELNVKHIETESQTDRRVKISSMARRQYIQAPSTNQIRNEGHHQTLIKSMDKTYKHEDLLAQRNLMQTSSANDGLQKDLQILPECVNFTTVKAGTYYETKLLIKNEDAIIQRVRITQPSNENIKVYQKTQGPIASGMSREIIVRFTVTNQSEANIYDTFQVHSKYRIYTIPVMAVVEGIDTSGTLNSKLAMTKWEIDQAKKKSNLRFPVREAKNLEEMIRQGNSNISQTGEFSGTLTAEYLPKINYDKTVNINTKKPDNKASDHETSQTGNA